MNAALRDFARQYKLLWRSVPAPIISLLMLSVVLMNFLANKELFSIGPLALDCGFTLSWLTFLIMDVICKHFGPKAALEVSATSILANLAFCLLFWFVSGTPGHWGAYYDCLPDNPAAADAADLALNSTIATNWYVVFGSALAMLVSSAVNSVTNWAVARRLKKDNFGAFALRSYVSTGIGQFVDNLVFATVVSHVLFGWSWTQVFACALVAASFELLCEIVASPLGYRLVRLWEADNVGAEYLTSRNLSSSSPR